MAIFIAQLIHNGQVREEREFEAKDILEAEILAGQSVDVVTGCWVAVKEKIENVEESEFVRRNVGGSE